MLQLDQRHIWTIHLSEIKHAFVLIWPSSLQLLCVCHLYQNRTFGVNGANSSQAGCYFCHPTSVTAPKRTPGVDSNCENHPLTPSFLNSLNKERDAAHTDASSQNTEHVRKCRQTYYPHLQCESDDRCDYYGDLHDIWHHCHHHHHPTPSAS